MGKEQAGKEPSIPLKVWTKQALTEGVIATSDPQTIFLRAKELNLTAVGIRRRNWVDFAQAEAAAANTGVKHLHVLELPVTRHVLNLNEPVAFIPKTTDALRELAALYSSLMKGGNLVNDNEVQRMLHTGNTIVVFQRESELTSDLLPDPNAFFGIDKPDSAKLQLARRLSEDPSRTHSPIITHDIRLTHPREIASLRFLASLYPNRLGIPPHALLNHILQPQWVLYAHFPRGTLARTLEIAQEINIDFPRPPRITPKSLPPEWHDNPHGFLEMLAEKGFNHLREQYRMEYHEKDDFHRRLRTELDLIKLFDYDAYLLICKEVSDYSRSRGILFTTTGSGTHSLTNFCLGITTVIPFDLDPRVFLSEDRQTNPPDIDFMFPYEAVEEIKSFVKNRYPDEVVNMIQVRTMRRKKIGELIDKANAKRQPQDQIRLDSAHIQSLANEGFPYEWALHASGLLFAGSVAPERKVGKTAPTPAAELNAEAVETLGLFKIDTLSSIGLQRIATAKELLARDNIKVEITPNDPNVLTDLFFEKENTPINTANTPHISRLFAILGRLAKKRRLALTMDHIELVLALARPATAAFRTDLFRYWEAGESPLIGYPEIEEALRETGMIIVFDEQQEVIEEILAEYGDRYPQKIVQRLSSQLAGFKQEYSFKRGHARAFARDIVYPQAWLAFYYPLQFAAAVLKTIGDYRSKSLLTASLTYPSQVDINWALRQGIEIALPHYNHIPPEPTVENGKIVIGLNIVSRSKKARIIYTDLYQKLKKTPDLKTYIESQLDQIGICLNVNPINRFPQHLHFNPDRERQTIVGLPISHARVTNRRGQQSRLTTFDSGQIIQTTVPEELAQQRIRRVDKYGYHQITIQRTNQFPETWKIV